MTLADGVERYVLHRRSNGGRLERSTGTLCAFARTFPGFQIADTTADHILEFLNLTPVSTVTWRFKYFTLGHFFQHWSDREVIPQMLMPTPKPVKKPNFLPHIYTTSELRALLMAVSQGRAYRRAIDEATVRTVLLFLYGTGAAVGEIPTIERSDVDLDNRLVNIRSSRSTRARRIPIGEALCGVLANFMRAQPTTQVDSGYLFATKTGRPLPKTLITEHFRRLREVAAVGRRVGGRAHPRVDDLRFTFAVHRITQWIDEGADLNRMLPALAAYMGQGGLGSTDRYLFLTPEKFRQDLNKLSPVHGKGHWGEDGELMKYLSSL